MVVQHPHQVKFFYLTARTPPAQALVPRPFARHDIFQCTSPVNGWRVQARIVYDASGNRAMSSPPPSRDEAMVFEMRLDNGPWLQIVDPVLGTPLGAAGPAQLEENIFKHLGLTTTNTAAGAWGRFELLKGGTTNQGSLGAVRDLYHRQATAHGGMVTATQHRPRAPAAGLANLPVLAPAPPQQQQQQQQQQPQQQPQQQYQQQQMQYQFLVQPQQPQQHQQQQQQMQHQWQLQ
ncbi:hypothetical protein LTR23_004760 [Exophiala sp. CCFEE 6169]|nr:hypothetical protein LTR23_004760 [Chaetothyriales sp. CCFEE 6169]